MKLSRNSKTKRFLKKINKNLSQGISFSEVGFFEKGRKQNLKKNFFIVP